MSRKFMTLKIVSKRIVFPKEYFFENDIHTNTQLLKPTSLKHIITKPTY